MAYKGHKSQFRQDTGMKPGHSSYDHHQLAQPHNSDFKARGFHEEKGHYTKPHNIHLSPVSHTTHDVGGSNFGMNKCKDSACINGGGTNSAYPEVWHGQSGTEGKGYEMAQRHGSAYHGSKGYGSGTEFRGSRGYSEKK